MKAIHWPVLLRYLFYATCVIAKDVDETLNSKYIAASTYVSGPWSLSQHGTTGVAAMQLAIVSETKAVIYDKVEHNPLLNNGGLAWAVEYDIGNDAVRALNPMSNSWCASGAHLSNGTFINTGGNPMKLTGDTDGLEGVRIFTPCNDGNCDIFEDPARVRLASHRWYSSAARLEDGSAIVYGGSSYPGYTNNASNNNPTYEFFPPKNIHDHNGLPIPNQFLKDTLNANYFPTMFELPDGNLFIAANTQAMIFDWKKNIEIRLPGLPNGVRVSSPFSASAVMLPLSPENNYTPEILICGGSTASDTADPSTFSSQMPVSRQCSRMALNAEGITKGWQVEMMPQARIAANSILLPDGRVLIVGGAQTGTDGYGNIRDQVGASNADHPAFQAVVYDPSAAPGRRFSQKDIPISNIARMYHAVATLTPNATIMIAGSNPNEDVSTVEFPTEYRVEWLSPSYLNYIRPTYTGLPAIVDFGTIFTLYVTLPPSTRSVVVSLIDFGFATHGSIMGQRLVHLINSLSEDRSILTVHAPPNGMVYPPGPAYLFVLTDTGVPSRGHKTLIGTGVSPPVYEGAIANLLANTPGPYSY